MKEAFVAKSFREESRKAIRIINRILDEYDADGYKLTLRQLYYQMVSRTIIENSAASYDRLGALVSNARLAGLVDWAMIEDRGRETEWPAHWDGPSDIIAQAADQFRIDKWQDQPNHVEVMVEKQALEGVLIPVCHELDIRFSANKGYSSSSAMYEAGQRIAEAVEEGKSAFILYLGDHDPSGLDMTRDVEERARLFSRGPVEVRRLALNLDQVESMSLPKNAAKLKDKRAKAYVAKYGPASWELDAIEPRQLVALVRRAVRDLRDSGLWKKAVAKESEMRTKLLTLAEGIANA
jgi:hypothetical protein